ncbi:MAG TPA: hypothetical protein VNK04_17750 [Gemmataceae bacterium]|nr:hypothetical protein [Gemmataceae bacterium]
MASFFCPVCLREHAAPDGQTGERPTCPTCGAAMVCREPAGKSALASVRRWLTAPENLPLVGFTVALFFLAMLALVMGFVAWGSRGVARPGPATVETLVGSARVGVPPELENRLRDVERRVDELVREDRNQRRRLADQELQAQAEARRRSDGDPALRSHLLQTVFDQFYRERERWQQSVKKSGAAIEEELNRIRQDYRTPENDRWLTAECDRIIQRLRPCYEPWE